MTDTQDTQSNTPRKKHKPFTPKLRAVICKHHLIDKWTWIEIEQRVPHVSAAAARCTVKRAVQRAGSEDNTLVLKNLHTAPRTGRPRRSAANMDIKNSSTIISPPSLVRAGVPTASVALLSKGRVSTHVITTGSEDKETLYQACSISKAITALAVAKLVDQGHLTYATRIAEHLPQEVVNLIVDSNTKHLFQHLTVSHLLSHTSGLSQHGFPGYDLRDDLPTVYNVLAGVPPANTPMVHFTTFPGAQYGYSGGGFTILQLFLEALLLKPFASVMHEMVLEPLGMTRSYFDPLPEEEANYSAPYLTGYLKAPSGPHRFVELAAAGLWTTPSDLLKAIAAIQASLDPTQVGFLSHATAQEMLKPVQYVRSGNSIAHGWFVTDTAFGHTGGNEPGYGCYAVGFRPKDKDTPPAKLSAAPWGGALVVMTNASYSNQAVWNVVSAVFHLQNWPRLTALPGGMVDGEWRAVSAPVGTAIDASWRDWMGDWQGGWKLVSIDEKPAIQFGELEAMALVAAAAPVHLPESSKSVVALVVDGLKVQATLAWDSGEKVVILLQQESKTLRRAVV
jgi:CubicO group peptidase (beta-lactamase class C family)